MEHIYTDLAILGGGVAGMHAYKAALKSGVQPIIIEMGPIGKTSLHCGYIPTQILRKLSLQKTKTKGKNSNMPFLISANDATIHNHNPLQIIKQQSQKFIDNYIKALEENNTKLGCEFTMLCFTDVIKNGSYVIYTEKAKDILSSGFKKPDFEQMTYIKGLASRKKQMVPVILSELE